MFLRVINKKNGPYMTIVEKYRDQFGVARDKTIESPGYVSKYSHLYDDPIAHFQAVVDQRNKERLELKSVSISLHMDESLNIDDFNLKNVGYGILKRIYLELELDKFWKKVVRNKKIQFDIDAVFQLLVFSRILFPASKKKTWENRFCFFEDFSDISYDDIISALDIFALYENELQAWIYDHSLTAYHRDLSVGYFDCTNYFFDISRPDLDDYDDDGNILFKRYRKYGPEKNHRHDPIVGMGLLIDKSGIPLAYDLFPGNESEKNNMLPIINRARTDYGFGRIIVVADRGLNTSDNIYYLNGKNDQDDNPRDGYVYGQSIRGADKEFKEWVLNQKGYINTEIKNSDASDLDESGIFRHKSRIYPKKIYIQREHSDGNITRQSITVDQKQMVYYSPKYAKKQKIDRERCIQRAVDLVAHPKKYDKVSAKGASGFILNLSFKKDSGEVIDKELKVDWDKIHEEEKYDGYYSIVTSELNMSDIEIREIYRGLINIEETFKVTKSEFDTRPIYVWTNEHIDAHFTTCFTALVIIRLLQSRTGYKYSVGKIIESLKKYSCTLLNGNYYQFVYYDRILQDCAKSFGIELSDKYKTKNQIRRLLKY